MANYLYIGIDLQEAFLTDELKHADFVQRVESFQNKQGYITKPTSNNPSSEQNTP